MRVNGGTSGRGEGGREGRVGREGGSWGQGRKGQGEDVLLSLGEVLRDELVVAKEEPDADDGEHDVDARAEPGGLFEGELLRFEGFFL